VTDGLDPNDWAARFLIAYAVIEADASRSDAQRQTFVAQWFRAAMQAAAISAEAGWMEMARRRDADGADG
jgi:hypothetical protein